MSISTVPVSDMAKGVLQSLAAQTGQSVQQILDKAVEDYRRKVFLDAVNAGYAEMRDDSKAWAEHLEERKAWDATLMDGTDSTEQWTDDGRCLTADEGGK